MSPGYPARGGEFGEGVQGCWRWGAGADDEGKPNDQYLCIVPKQSAAPGTGGLFLPFEGARVLAVILSKAML